ncbi:MAG: hypothetical protein M3P38_01065 [Chloroflexota bacterium]|nr:hypothetical protein [Chloroflexota bacterium]
MRDPQPRAVVLGACDAIAASLDGFRYAPSKLHATRARGDWKEVVYFQASVHNRRGTSIDLSVGINVRNRRLARWRKEVHSPVRDDDWVAGSYLGYLADDGRGAEPWDLRSGSTRAVKDITRRLSADAMPFFAVCTDVRELIDAAPQRWLDRFRPSDVFELLLCYGQTKALDRYLAGLWKAKPMVQADAREWLAETGRLNSRTGEVAPSDHGEALARLLTHHQMVNRIG